jgi:DNA-directed RNA polymerase I subunit RPA1
MLNSCTTCRMTSWSCTGHSGHIELPIHVFNITFFDQMFRLLKAQCVYCQKLRISRLQVNDYTCKLRLLQYGLANEAALVDKIGRTISRASHTHSDRLNGANLDEDLDEDSDAHESGNTLEFDLEDLIEKRKDFTKQCIKLAKLERTSEPMAGAKDPVAAEERRQLLRMFFKDIVATKKCSSCHG